MHTFKKDITQRFTTESQQMEIQRSTFSMGEDASRVNVSSGVITFNPCLHTHNLEKTSKEGSKKEVMKRRK